MKKFLAAAIVITLCAAPIKSFASEDISPEEAIKNVEAFYMELQKKMNKSEYDQALSMIDKHFAKDFLHYDDGEVSYGKDGMILFVENHRNSNVRTRMDINIIDTAFDPEKSEVVTNFHISQKFYKRSKESGEEYEDTGSRLYLTCSDSLRVEKSDSFELYKCDCVTNKTDPVAMEKAETNVEAETDNDTTKSIEDTAE